MPAKKKPVAPPSDQKDRYRIIGARFQNIHNIELVELKDLPPHLVRLSGKHGAGKSSTMLGIKTLIQKLDPGEVKDIVRRGEDFGEIGADFVDGFETPVFRVIRRFEADGRTAIHIENKQSKKKEARPAEMMAKLAGRLPRDIGDLMLMSPKDRRAFALQVAGIADVLSVLNQEKDKIYVQRTAANAEKKAAAGAVTAFGQEVQAVEAPYDLSTLQAERQELVEQ